MTESSGDTFSHLSDVSDLDSMAELLRRRMVMALIHLPDCHACLEQLDPEQIIYILENIQSEIIDSTEELGASVTIEAPDQYLILFGYPDQHHDEALRCVTHITRLMFRMKEMAKDIEKQGLTMPQFSFTAHVGDVLVGPASTVDTETYQVLGKEMTLLRHVSKYTPPSECHVTEPLMDDVLRQMPPNWYHYACDEESSPWTSVFDLDEDVFDSENTQGEAGEETIASEAPAGHRVHSDLQRQVISVGIEPSGQDLPGDPEFVFRSYHKVQPKDFEQGIEVFELTRPAEYVPNFNFDPRIANEVGADRLFGKYRLNRLLGRGGMGEVWQGVDSFGNSVAVKMLLAGSMASDRQLKRFRREAEIMAQLNHRNICRIYEVGEVGRITYIAMEYVDGVSLSEILNATDDEMAAFEKSQNFQRTKTPGSDTDVGGLVRHLLDQKTIDPDAEQDSNQALDEITYLKRKKIKSGRRYQVLPLQQTLMLISSLCEAVQFAHENGIYHRDLKPANLMLRSDGDPVVMDFGLAKLTDSEQEHSISVTDQIMGTIDYMAPEQAISAKDIDERADVYSIGAILYQLITGEKHFKATGNLIFDAQRLQEHTPKRLRALNPKIDLDLELVVLKSLRSEPDQRYRSVSAFLEDILRYRKGEIIFARDITLREILLRNFKRNKVVSIISVAAAVAIIALMLGSYVIVWQEEVKNYRQNIRLRESLREVSRQKNELQVVRREAIQQKKRNNAIRRFMYEILTGAGQQEGNWRDWALHETMKTASQSISAIYQDDPLLQAEFHDTLGRVYIKHAEWPLAEEQFNQAWNIRTSQLGALDPVTIQSAEGLVVALTELGHYDRALEMQRKIIKVHHQRLGEEHPRSVFAAYQLAMILIRSDEYHKAEEILRMLIRPVQQADSQVSLADIQEAFAATSGGQEQVSKARAVIKDILKAYEAKEDRDEARSLSLRHNLAVMTLLDGDIATANDMFEKLHSDRIKLLGESHLDTLSTLSDMAVVAETLGEYLRAKGIYTQVHEQLSKKFGPMHLKTIQVRMNLARLVANGEDLDRGLTMMDQVIRDCNDHLGSDHAMTQDARYARLILLSRHRPDPTLIEQLDAIYQIRKSTLGEHHPRALQALVTLAELYMQLEKYPEARAHLQRLNARVVQQLGPYHQQSIQTGQLLTLALHQLLDYEGALRVCEDLLKTQTKAFGPLHPKTIQVKRIHLDLLVDAGKYDQAFHEYESLISAILNSNEGNAIDTATLIDLKQELSRLAIRMGLDREAIQTAKSIYDVQSKGDYVTEDLGLGAALYARSFRHAGQHENALKVFDATARLSSMALVNERIQTALELQDFALFTVQETQWRRMLDEAYPDDVEYKGIRLKRLKARELIARNQWDLAIQALEEALLLMGPELSETAWRSVIVQDLMTMYLRTEDHGKLMKLWSDHQAKIRTMELERFKWLSLQFMAEYAAYRKNGNVSEDLRDLMTQMLSQERAVLIRNTETLLILCELLIREDRMEDAESLLQEHMNWVTRRFPDGHWRTMASKALLTRLFALQKQQDLAIKQLQEVEVFKAKWGKDQPYIKLLDHLLRIKK